MYHTCITYISQCITRSYTCITNVLHLQSIKDRTARLKRHNIYGWNDLTRHNPHQFGDYNELETILLNHLHSVKLKDAEAS